MNEYELWHYLMFVDIDGKGSVVVNINELAEKLNTSDIAIHQLVNQGIKIGLFYAVIKRKDGKHRIFYSSIEKALLRLNRRLGCITEIPN